jgi:hypothetical protein
MKSLTSGMGGKAWLIGSQLQIFELLNFVGFGIK